MRVELVDVLAGPAGPAGPGQAGAEFVGEDPVAQLLGGPDLIAPVATSKV